jgi:hypothetical protein
MIPAMPTQADQIPTRLACSYFRYQGAVTNRNPALTDASRLPRNVRWTINAAPLWQAAMVASTTPQSAMQMAMYFAGGKRCMSLLCKGTAAMYPT